MLPYPAAAAGCRPQLLLTTGTLPPGLAAAAAAGLDHRLAGEGHLVYFWSTLNAENFGHFLGEFFPTLHTTLCGYAGRCDLASAAGLHLAELFPPSAAALRRQAAAVQRWQAARQAGAGAPEPPLLAGQSWAQEAAACFTQAPVLHIHDPGLKHKALLVRRAPWWAWAPAAAPTGGAPAAPTAEALNP